jgi:hypothetical protein
MNTITRTASPNTAILAIDLGKCKSVACVHDQATGEHGFMSGTQSPWRHREFPWKCWYNELKEALAIFQRVARKGAHVPVMIELNDALVAQLQQKAAARRLSLEEFTVHLLGGALGYALLTFGVIDGLARWISLVSWDWRRGGHLGQHSFISLAAAPRRTILQEL